MQQQWETMSGYSGTWCLVSIGDEKVKAKIMHVGRGKYRIVEDEAGRYAGKKVDASDVFHCKYDISLQAPHLSKQDHHP
jgi:hypothetical protein